MMRVAALLPAVLVACARSSTPADAGSDAGSDAADAGMTCAIRDAGPETTYVDRGYCFEHTAVCCSDDQCENGCLDHGRCNNNSICLCANDGDCRSGTICLQNETVCGWCLPELPAACSTDEECPDLPRFDSALPAVRCTGGRCTPDRCFTLIEGRGP